MSRIGALRERGLQALATSPAGRWYREQSPRDQRILLLLAGFLLLVGVWLLPILVVGHFLGAIWHIRRRNEASVADL